MKYSDFLSNVKEPQTDVVGFRSLFQMISKYTHISVLDRNGIKNFNDAESEFFSHMKMFDTLSLISVSDLKGNIIFANDKFCKASKYSREELLGMPHSIIRHSDTPSHVFKEMWKSVGNGKFWQGELKNLAKDGSPYWVIATVAPVLGKNGKPIRYISMRIDISMQKKAEEELMEARKKLDIDLYENVNYGKQVYNSFLTPREELKVAFPESFLIYKAQKIISGDFYRLDQRNGQSVIILGDSTGHGVPASYISIMVLNILNRLLKSGGKNPSKILQSLHREINKITHLNKKHPISETADTIVCCIDHNLMKMDYASAKMKGVIIRKGKIIELKRDPCSVGDLSEKDLLVSNHHIHLEKGDCIYLFTDGMTDQIGGIKNKTFRIRKLMEVLVENHSFPMSQQKKNISKIMNEWQGGNEQTDDMTLLGFRIL